MQTLDFHRDKKKNLFLVLSKKDGLSVSAAETTPLPYKLTEFSEQKKRG